jgi:hypothetical protein
LKIIKAFLWWVLLFLKRFRGREWWIFYIFYETGFRVTLNQWTNNYSKEKWMVIKGSVIAMRGVTFAIVIMKIRVVESQEQTDDALKLLASVFPGVPTVIMALDDKGVPKYRGPQEIIDLVGSINIALIPWKMYKVTLPQQNARFFNE